MHQERRAERFLVLEDNADDAFLIRRAFSLTAGCAAFICRNTSEARAYIQGAGMYADRAKFPFPDAIVSDLRLGEESGIEFLHWLRGVPEFKDVPVVLLSGSASPKEMAAASELNAIKVLRKPAELNALKKMLAELAAELVQADVSSNLAPAGAGRT